MQVADLPRLSANGFRFRHAEISRYTLTWTSSCTQHKLAEVNLQSIWWFFSSTLQNMCRETLNSRKGKGTVKTHPRTGHEGRKREQRYSSLSLTSALDGSGWSKPSPGYFTPGKEEAGWTPGPVWRGAKNLAPTGIRSPDHPARSKSLHRLSYSGPCETHAYL
jgi:hypothetical protein